MDVATFCHHLAGQPQERFRSRFFTGVSVRDELELIHAYGAEFKSVPVAPFVHGERFVIMPPALFQELEDAFTKIRQDGKLPILTGLDPYLALLNRANRIEAFRFLLRFANASGSKTNIVILRGTWPEMEEVFSNPSLRGNDWISCSFNGPEPVDVVLVPQRFSGKIRGNGHIAALSDWLKERAAGSVRDEYVAVKFNSGPFPGLDGGHVRQVPDAQSFLVTCCSYDDAQSLDDEQCEWVLKETDGYDVDSALARKFFPDGLHDLEKTSLTRYSRIADAAERSMFLKFLEQHAGPCSYLSRILRRMPKDGNAFMEYYLRPVEEDIDAPDATSLAAERQAAIKTLEQESGRRTFIETAQEEFLAAAKNVPDEKLAPWADIGLSCEEREWIRRYMAHGGNVSATVKSRSRFLQAYLSKAGTGIARLDSYFREYRERKAANKIDSAFCGRAFQEEIPGAELDARDGEIAKACTDADAFLFVVDGLGAEWIPFIVSIANEYNVRILDAKCVVATLPSSTEYNPTLEIWGADERCRKIDDLDKIYHKQGLTPEEGLFLEFEEVERVLGIVKQALAKHSKVFLTADHGASRLATLAYGQELAQTILPGENGIPANLTPEKWRFAAIPDGSVVSCRQVVPSLSGKWACVRGYNRFSISGGPTFELHGGATIEECVVPWIEFGKGFNLPFLPKKEDSASSANILPADQIETVKVFDDL